MNFWKHFDFVDVVFNLAKIYGREIPSVKAHNVDYELLPRSLAYSESTSSSLANPTVMQLHVSDRFGGHPPAPGELHFYFVARKIPIHVSVHPSNSPNNFHLTFNEAEHKTAFARAHGTCWIACPLVVHDELLLWNAEFLRRVNDHVVPYADRVWGVRAGGHVYEFLLHFASVMRALYRDRNRDLLLCRKTTPIPRLPTGLFDDFVFTKARYESYVASAIQQNEDHQKYLRRKYGKGDPELEGGEGREGPSRAEQEEEGEEVGHESREEAECGEPLRETTDLDLVMSINEDGIRAWKALHAKVPSSVKRDLEKAGRLFCETFRFGDECRSNFSHWIDGLRACCIDIYERYDQSGCGSAAAAAVPIDSRTEEELSSHPDTYRAMIHELHEVCNHTLQLCIEASCLSFGEGFRLKHAIDFITEQSLRSTHPCARLFVSLCTWIVSELVYNFNDPAILVDWVLCDSPSLPNFKIPVVMREALQVSFSTRQLWWGAVDFFVFLYANLMDLEVTDELRDRGFDRWLETHPEEKAVFRGRPRQGTRRLPDVTPDDEVVWKFLHETVSQVKPIRVVEKTIKKMKWSFTMTCVIRLTEMLWKESATIEIAKYEYAIQMMAYIKRKRDLEGDSGEHELPDFSNNIVKGDMRRMHAHIVAMLCQSVCGPATTGPPTTTAGRRLNTGVLELMRTASETIAKRVSFHTLEFFIPVMSHMIIHEMELDQVVDFTSVFSQHLTDLNSAHEIAKRLGVLHKLVKIGEAQGTPSHLRQQMAMEDLKLQRIMGVILHHKLSRSDESALSRFLLAEVGCC